VRVDGRSDTLSYTTCFCTCGVRALEDFKVLCLTQLSHYLRFLATLGNTNAPFVTHRYYWKDAAASRGHGRTQWTGAWNLLRVDTLVLDEEEHTLTLNFDDIRAGKGCDVTQKVLKCSDLEILKRWETSIRERMHYFRSGELEASFVRQLKKKKLTKKSLAKDGSEPPLPKQLHDDQKLWGITSIDNSAVYYIGIVDCFTTFDTTRGISYFFEGSNKSNVPPDMYARRFFNVNKTRFD